MLICNAVNGSHGLPLHVLSKKGVLFPADDIGVVFISTGLTICTV